MKPESQRIAIAEACGWKWFYSKHNHWIVDGPDGEHFSPGFGDWQHFDPETGNRNDPFPKWYGCDFLPDYLNDLNAMHEAEKVLTNKQLNEYGAYLRGPNGETVSLYSPEHREIAAVSMATAAQRAESFLRAIDKWENDK